MINTIRKTGKFPLMIALAFSAVLGVQGNLAYVALANKAQAQEGVTESVQRWKQSYLALGDSVKKWGASYRREDSVQDLVSLFAVVNLEQYGLQVNTDSLLLNKVEPETRNGMAIGLTKICLASAGSAEGGSLEVSAPNYQALFAGLKRLSSRKDIFISTITVRGAKLTPVANLGDFCVLMRKS
jgi:hypothetical protein